MDTSRVERLLALIQAIQRGGTQTADELASRLQVSKRTVFRDMDVLRRSGLPYTFDRAARSYSAAANGGGALPPITFTAAEALTLLTMLRNSARHPSALDPAVAAALALKVEGMLPAPIRDFCEPRLGELDFRHGPASDSASLLTTIPIVQAALAKRSPIAIAYDSYYEGRVIDDTLEVHRLVYIHRGWYVIARSRTAREMRTFKLERIVHLRVIPETYELDPAFSLESYFGDAWLMIRGEPSCTVRIHFAPKVAGNVDEIRWHRTQRTQYLADGSLLFDVHVDGLGEIIWWVLGYGDQAEVLEPHELRQLVARHARAMLQKHEVADPIAAVVASGGRAF